MGNVLRGKGFRWPKGKIPFIIDDDVSESDVQAAMAQWTSTGVPISFVPYTGPLVFATEAYVKFVLGDAGSSCKTVAGRRFPGQEVICRPGSSSLVHELGHTLGLKHEQQRFDRDLFVAVLPDNVQTRYRGNFTRLGVDEVIAIGPYDYLSRMHYGGGAFAVDFEVNLDIPGMSSPVAPAAAFLGDELHLVFTDGDRDLFHTWTTDLISWEPKRRIEDQSTKAPSTLVEFGGDLFLFHLGRTSNDVWVSRSTDGRTFEPNRRIQDVSSRAAPAVAEHNGKLHMLFVGADDNAIRRSSSTTGRFDDWTEPRKIEDQLSKAGPALASDGSVLHMTHLGNSSDDIWYSTSSDGVAWSTNTRIGQQAKATTAMASFGGSIHLAHLGESSNQIWHSNTQVVDSVTKFRPNNQTNQLARQRPALTAGTLNGTAVMVLSHIGDTSNRMYVSLYNPGLRSMVRAPGQPAGPLGGSSISAGDIAAVNFMYG